MTESKKCPFCESQKENTQKLLDYILRLHDETLCERVGLNDWCADNCEFNAPVEKCYRHFLLGE